MPDKPTWLGHLDGVIAELDALPYPWIDRLTREKLLRVGRRRAQQILRLCGTHQVGASAVADRGRLIACLRQLASGEAAYYERRRRVRLAESVELWRQDWQRRPKVHVEAPAAMARLEFDDLPGGVDIGPGQITVRFQTPREALEKLLALALAIGNDFQRFERLTGP